MKNKTSLLKKIIFIAILIYAIITFINQQKILNTYSEQEKSLNTQIAEASEYQNKLNEEKDNVNSPEYIEAIAREKLDMYVTEWGNYSKKITDLFENEKSGGNEND